MPTIAIIAIILLTVINFYIANRLSKGLKLFLPFFGFLTYFIILSIASLLLILGFVRSMLPLPTFIKHPLGTLSSYYMGVIVYLLIYILIADLLLLTVRIIRGKKTFLLRTLCTALAVVLTVITVSSGISNANNVKTVSYEVSCSKNLSSDINIALITDLHLGATGSEERLESIVNKLNETEPDIVCIAGDLFDNDFSAIKNPDRAARLLGSINSKYGTYACLGNHDAGKTLPEMEELLQKANVNLLKDDWIVIDNTFTIVGRLDPSPIEADEGGSQKRGDTASVMSGIDTSMPVIVMDHNPANIDEYGADTDLIMCGHTHRGQIFPGSIITSLIYTVDYGYYKADKNSPSVVVTSGVGTWGPPIRVGTSSEIAVIRLSSR